ncbi:hypothetical protein Hdeb2414_s0028g00702571 [Helianthus debilis subsp. tardiflorus]
MNVSISFFTILANPFVSNAGSKKKNSKSDNRADILNLSRRNKIRLRSC